ncbi:MAG: phosphatidate cytidylyltransferase [Xanthobacteraceae bacterium]
MTLSAPPDSARANRPRASNLTLRVASAVVLAPVTLAITYVGGWIFYALCAIAAGGILWEWVSLASHRADPRVLAPGWLALLGATVLIGLGLSAGGMGALAIGVIVAGSIVAALPRATDEPSAPAWATGGVFYAGALLIAPAMLRSDPQWGLIALLFLFANVWATDIFAYFCGRAIGGPLLWPRVSPKKTWSGAVGGLAGGVAASVAVAYASGVGKLGIVGVMACVLSVLAQAGDLFESSVKRRFGAKDASHLIPGHGGLMDRLDGFIVAALAALLIGIIHQGIAAPARGLLLW